jgi:hypothetical protein
MLRPLVIISFCLSMFYFYIVSVCISAVSIDIVVPNKSLEVEDLQQRNLLNTS